MALVGLVRVSTDAQETQRQHDALDDLCVRVFEEKISGAKKATDRPGMRAALDYLRDGDMLTVQEADRLGRNLLDGLLTLSDLFERGVSVKVLDGIAAGEHTERSLILDLALALAEDRRRDISRKTKNGLDAARKRGTTGGRPTVLTDDRRRTILARRAEDQSIRQIARGVGVSPAVVHGVIHEADHTDPAPAEHGGDTAAPPAPQSSSAGRESSARAGKETVARRTRARPAAPAPEPANDAAVTGAGPRAIAGHERIDPDTVTTERNPDTGTTRVLATSNNGEPVLVGFLDRTGKQWHAQGPHMTRLPGHWRTKNEALLRLVEAHARG